MSKVRTTFTVATAATIAGFSLAKGRVHLSQTEILEILGNMDPGMTHLRNPLGKVDENILNIRIKYALLRQLLEDHSAYCSVINIRDMLRNDRQLQETLKRTEGLLQQEKLTTGAITEIDTSLQQALDELGGRLKEDKEKILMKIQRGSEQITPAEITEVRKYLKECVRFSLTELTTTEGKHADYLKSGRLQELILRFIGNDGSPQGIKIPFVASADEDAVREIITFYQEQFSSTDSPLTLHHLAEIGKRLEREQDLTDLILLWGPAIVIGGVLLLAIMTVRKITKVIHKWNSHVGRVLDAGSKAKSKAKEHGPAIGRYFSNLLESLQRWHGKRTAQIPSPPPTPGRQYGANGTIIDAKFVVDDPSPGNENLKGIDGGDGDKNGPKKLT